MTNMRTLNGENMFRTVPTMPVGVQLNQVAVKQERGVSQNTQQQSNVEEASGENISEERKELKVREAAKITALNLSKNAPQQGKLQFKIHTKNYLTT